MPLNSNNASDRTHDVSLINYHVKDLALFGDCLTEAANAVFPSKNCRYKEVHGSYVSE